MESTNTTDMEFYKATVGSSREARMWNKTEQIIPILKDLEERKDKIGKISLADNSIGLEVAEALAGKISGLKNLTHAYFDNIFVSRVKEELPKALNFLTLSIEDKNIYCLNLSDNAFGPSGVAAIEFYLKKVRTLKEFFVENCGLGPEGAETMASALKSNPELKLERLRIGRNRLENKGAGAFGSYFSSTDSLIEVFAFQNGIKEEGMKAFLSGLKSNKRLQNLKINDNIITDESFPSLLDLISNLPELTIIDVSDLNLGCENSVELFKELSKSKTIKEIQCNYNDIEEKSAQTEIYNSLANLDHNLTKLELKGNEINKNVFKKIKTHENLKDADCYSESEMEADELEELMGSLSIK